MPIKIPDTLPARALLEQEGVMVMTESTAVRQDIRPLRIGLLNLMPDKIATETQIARLIASTPLQVELTLIRVGTHASKNTSEDHLISFYCTWHEVKDQNFDGFIITGAPIETLSFDDVTYWSELTEILDWTTTNVHSTFSICWGAEAHLARQGVRRLSAPQPAADIAVSHGIFGRLLSLGLALDRSAQSRHRTSSRPRTLDGIRRDGRVPHL
jgi:homoserine O-succinyltransferase